MATPTATKLPVAPDTSSPLAALPTVRGLPFLGSLPEFRSDRLGLLLRVGRECGEIGAFRIGPRTIVMVSRRG